MSNSQPQAAERRRSDDARADRPAPSSVVIEDLRPLLDCGRHRVKRCVGDPLNVSALVFRDGHDKIQVAARFRAPGAGQWTEVPMKPLDADRGGDRFGAGFTLPCIGRWSWQVIAWTDHFATWQDELERKLAAGQSDVESELVEGAALLGEVEARTQGVYREAIAQARSLLADVSVGESARKQVALDRRLGSICSAHAGRADQASSDVVEVDVERELARFGCWYELFPRSWGGFAGVSEAIPDLARLGVDVLYLPPIHPIGRTRRRGPNDTGQAGPSDPGSPWAIGAAEGGHTAIHPELGTMQDFERLVGEARDHGIEIALDFAAQCSADHPWITEHPEWFAHRPDGTLKHAENPPKRYLDIYNFDFESSQWRSLWQALLEVVRFWVAHGVRVFRVDNPHTKPLAFWEWLIESVRRDAPETIFLSEAFTRAAKMQALAKVGFSQSYTYFTWKNSTAELRDYMSELSRPPVSEYLRANLFVNTPDILTEYLQHGGPAAFAARLLLAATLSPTYGIYSGFESFEATPRHQGSEEYLNSEKYQLRERALDGPLLPMIGALNAIRREHPALRRIENVSFLPVENEALIAYVKRDASETLIAVVNVDPHARQEGIVVVPAELGLPPVFAVHDLLSDERWEWRIGRNYVALDPAQRPGHLLAVGEG